jgi:hypothetical protein
MDELSSMLPDVQLNICVSLGIQGIDKPVMRET